MISLLLRGPLEMYCPETVLSSSVRDSHKSSVVLSVSVYIALPPIQILPLQETFSFLLIPSFTPYYINTCRRKPSQATFLLALIESF